MGCGGAPDRSLSKGPLVLREPKCIVFFPELDLGPQKRIQVLELGPHPRADEETGTKVREGLRSITQPVRGGPEVRRSVSSAHSVSYSSEQRRVFIVEKVRDKGRADFGEFGFYNDRAAVLD